MSFRRMRFRGGAFYASLACCFALGSATATATTQSHTTMPWIGRATPIRIMALGDSITAGVGKNGIDLGTGGYRASLEGMLEAQGYDFAMIGSRSDYSEHLTMRGHEGWPGYVIRSYPSAPAHELLGALTRDAVESYEPDVILLMAGTNDLLRATRHAHGYTVSGALDGLDALIGQIVALEPDVTIVVAGVVDSPKIARCDVAAFDGTSACGPLPARSMQTIVAAYAIRGYHIVAANDMAGAVARDAQHFPDGIHPSGDGGYVAVAKAWMAALDRVTRPGSPQTIAGP